MENADSISSDACCNIFHHLSLYGIFEEDLRLTLTAIILGSVSQRFSDLMTAYWTSIHLQRSNIWTYTKNGSKTVTHGALKITKGETILCYLRERAGSF